MIVYSDNRQSSYTILNSKKKKKNKVTNEISFMSGFFDLKFNEKGGQS